MAAERHHPSVLDERLAEIDRRLKSIQSGLEPDSAADSEPASAADDEPASAADSEPPRTGPRPPRPLRPAPDLPPLGPPEPPETTEPGELAGQLHELVDSHERLLSATRALLGAYTTAPARNPAAVRISVGPLSSIEALEDFQRRLSELPGVGNVSLREFEGEDRAVVDVHLVGPTS